MAIRRLAKEVGDFLHDTANRAVGFRLTGLSAVLAVQCQMHIEGRPRLREQGLEEHGVTVFEPATEGKAVDGVIALQWEILGEAGTPMEGGHWQVEVFPPDDYPFKPCTFHITTPCFHPDVPLSKVVELIALGGRREESVVLTARLVAARDALLLPTPSKAEEGGPEVEVDADEPTVAVTFLSVCGDSREVSLAASSTVADAQRRYERAMQKSSKLVSGARSSANFIYKGKQWTGDCTLSVLGVQAGDTIHVVHKLFAAPCGPIAILEGGCDSCREKFYPHSPALKIEKTLWYLRSSLHAHRELRAEMEREVPADAAAVDAMPAWTPWIAAMEPAKVRNLRAGVLLAEGNIDEYEKQAAALIPLCSLRTVVLQASFDGTSMHFVTLGGEEVFQIEAAATDHLADIRGRLMREIGSSIPRVDVVLPGGKLLSETLSAEPLAVLGLPSTHIS